MPSQRIHCYAASFGNDLAKNLINKNKFSTGTILDPFAGSGTTLVEALSAGYEAIGIDIDPIACLISRTQIRKYEKDWLISFEKKDLKDLDSLENSLLKI